MDLKEDYKQYLLSPTWKEIRDKAVIRARGRCQLCNSDILIQVHHRKYPKVWGTEPQSDLTVLCERCHYNFHASIQSRELPIEIELPAKKEWRSLPIWHKEIIKRHLKLKLACNPTK